MTEVTEYEVPSSGDVIVNMVKKGVVSYFQNTYKQVYTLQTKFVS